LALVEESESDGGSQEIVDAIATLNAVDRQIVIDFIEVLKKTFAKAVFTRGRSVSAYIGASEA